jgi:hypothetical protein
VRFFSTFRRSQFHSDAQYTFEIGFGSNNEVKIRTFVFCK